MRISFLICLLLITCLTAQTNAIDAVEAINTTQANLQQKNDALFITKLEQKANMGSAQAQFKLGLIYFTGEKTDHSYSKVIATQSGFKPYQSKHIFRNYKLAKHWLTKASFKNHASAQNTLARIYFFGLGTKQNIEKAHAWASIAHDNGSKKAGIGLTYIHKKITQKQLENAKIKKKMLLKTINDTNF